jgi:hypothetical protein
VGKRQTSLELSVDAAERMAHPTVYYEKIVKNFAV